MNQSSIQVIQTAANGRQTVLFTITGDNLQSALGNEVTNGSFVPPVTANATSFTSVGQTQQRREYQQPRQQIASLQPASLQPSVQQQSTTQLQQFNNGIQIPSYQQPVQVVQPNPLKRSAQPIVKGDFCTCGLQSNVKTVFKNGANYGRQFEACATKKCEYFAWIDEK